MVIAHARSIPHIIFSPRSADQNLGPCHFQELNFITNNVGRIFTYRLRSVYSWIHGVTAVAKKMHMQFHSLFLQDNKNMYIFNESLPHQICRADFTT